MYLLDYDRVAILDYLRELVERIREAAKNDPGQLGECLRMAAEEIASDTANLEADLRALGYLPKPANEP